jgi:hypothetical protein
LPRVLYAFERNKRGTFSKMKRIYVVLLLGAAAAGLGTAALATGAAMKRTPPPAAAPIEISIAPRHSLADLEELPTGITYDEAARMLGTPGHAETRSAATLSGIAAEVPASVYSWPNPDGSRIILVFQKDLLTHKTHEGLR